MESYHTGAGHLSDNNTELVVVIFDCIGNIMKWYERKRGDISGKPLTKREVQILAHIKNGDSNKEVAHKLCISEVTVKNHMTSVMQKLEAKNRTHAVVLYIASKKEPKMRLFLLWLLSYLDRKSGR